ncbi:MAG TPA: MBL fold metallo-hydrolase [Dehalococcoidales bacterium]|nr:MBL fold metallo-hydrolase [Dehalococcoidales bacterium]
MKAYILQLGYLELDSICLTTFATRATREHPRIQHDWIKAPVWAVLVDTGANKMLFDLGCMNGAMAPDGSGWSLDLQNRSPWFCPKGQSIDEQLALIGLTTKQIDTVVLSHFHGDHFGPIDKFTHTDIYIPKEDWLNALMITHIDSNLGHQTSYLRQCLDVVVKQYHPVAIGEDFELFPGVEIITLPGHTANLLGMVLHLDSGKCLVFPSDAVPTPEVYGPPVRYGGSIFDSISYLKSIEKVRKLEQKLHAQVMVSHSEKIFAGFKKAPEYYD